MKYFLVKPEIAIRAGVAQLRFRTEDGLMILNEQDIRTMRLQPEEYVSGVVEKVVSEEEAATLIAQAGKLLGPPDIGSEDSSINVEISTDIEESSTSDNEGELQSEEDSVTEGSTTENEEEIIELNKEEEVTNE